MRRELLDSTRAQFGPHGDGARQKGGLCGHGLAGGFDPPDPQEDPADMERWTAFHESVAGLPRPEREVVDALFYNGLTQAEAAASLGLDARTIRRRWRAALLRLRAS